MSMMGFDGSLQLSAGNAVGTSSRKTAVRLATAAALPASTLVGTVLTANANGALPAIDGTAAVVGDRIFTHAGAAALQLIWTVTSLGSAGTPWVLTMANDADTGAKLLEASDLWVAEGATLAESSWELLTDAPITPGTTALAWWNASGTGAGSVGLYTVAAGVSVRDFVYISGVDTAAKATATSTATMPAIGCVMSKPTATSALVQFTGELTGFVGLTSNTTYFASTTAGAASTTAPVAAGNVVQKVAFAKDTTTMVILCDRDFIVL